jgi:hypothetical protein
MVMGVPEIVTELVVLEPSDSPDGRLPDATDQVNGLVPPADVSVAE